MPWKYNATARSASCVAPEHASQAIDARLPRIRCKILLNAAGLLVLHPVPRLGDKCQMPHSRRLRQNVANELESTAVKDVFCAPDACGRTPDLGDLLRQRVTEHQAPSAHAISYDVVRVQRHGEFVDRKIL